MNCVGSKTQILEQLLRLLRRVTDKQIRHLQRHKLTGRCLQLVADFVRKATAFEPGLHIQNRTFNGLVSIVVKNVVGSKEVGWRRNLHLHVTAISGDIKVHGLDAIFNRWKQSGRFAEFVPSPAFSFFARAVNDGQ